MSIDPCRVSIPGLLGLFFTAALFGACGEKVDTTTDAVEPSVERTGPLLVIHNGDERGITFQNQLREDSTMSYFTYLYVNNSGGVATGDLDQDGLPDVFLTSMRSPWRLYRNLGGLQFEDVTAKAGLEMGDQWAVGTTMADVNADGLLDIYVCISGPAGRDRSGLANKLFINKGGWRFEEKAKEFGLDDTGSSQMAYFQDFDGDLDLDMFLVATRDDYVNIKDVNHLVIVKPNSPFSDRLYVNNGNGTFTDRTAEAGLLDHAWGLAAMVGDMTGDGRPDIYVSNDFTEPDFFFANKGDMKFRRETTSTFRHISLFGMGSDRADIDNDGLQDMFVVDMTPPEHFDSKTNMASMRPKSFQLMVDAGWPPQYMTNALQLNHGNGIYSEVAHIAGVDRTDWSWSPLFVDFDNDGWKDLFVGNGVWRETGNNDAKIQFEAMKKSLGRNITFEQAMGLFPLGHAKNSIFRNAGYLDFQPAFEEWGYVHESVTTGASYADLDNDGDIDLITCDINAPVKIIENRSRDERDSHYLQVRLKAPAPNTLALGATVILRSASGPQYYEVALGRGFQSSVDPLVHFGVKDERIDSLEVHWPDGTWTVMTDVARDQRLVIDHTAVQHMDQKPRPEPSPYFKENAKSIGLDHAHVESRFDDFRTEILLPHSQSTHGPTLAVGDVNNDDLDDLMVGASAGQPAVLFIQNTPGRFARAAQQPWTKHSDQEIIGQHFFDADGDGDQDLYLAAGSTEFGSTDIRYQDRLYVNDGRGRFTEAVGALPDMPTSTQIVRAADVDGDGDMDLFVGGRNEPGAYPAQPKSYLLINESGRFTDMITELAPALEHIGMVTDAVFADVDKNGSPDLFICGEWMPVSCFKNAKGSFTDETETMLDKGMHGWWYDLTVADLDNDGDMDLVAGNIGLNNKFHPSREKPLEIFMADLDDSGTNDIVLAKHKDSTTCLPVRGRECSSEQMPFIKEKFGTYKSFAMADMDQLYGKDRLSKALNLKATEMRSMVFWNDDGRFRAEPLPRAAQISAMRGCVVADVNIDGRPDLILAGNLYGSEVETTRYDAGNGCVLLGGENGEFAPVRLERSGFFAPDDVRDVVQVRTGKGKTPLIVVSSNSAALRSFTLLPSSKDKLAGLR